MIRSVKAINYMTANTRVGNELSKSISTYHRWITIRNSSGQAKVKKEAANVKNETWEHTKVLRENNTHIMNIYKKGKQERL